MKWYTNNYRRHLCDMHIADWNPEFLSEFDPENYVAMLCKAQVQTAMLYYQSHVGLCYFPSKVAPVHKAFQVKPDMMRRVEELCHENGITTVGYYSVTYNTWAEEAHPEWAMVSQIDGTTPIQTGSRYGRCCPNNMEYRAFVKVQIQEMLDYFKPDGMFYDMPFWSVPCACRDCRKRWKQETGLPWPADADDDQLMAARRRWMTDFTQFITAETKALRPGIPVEYNCAGAALPGSARGIAEGMCRSGDYVGGDLYHSFRTQSLACKYYACLTPNPPFEYMTGRCTPNLAAHTITKTKDRLTLAVMLTVAHNGANLVIDAIDPCGTLDPRLYTLLGEIYGEAKKYEPSMNGKLRAEALVYFDQTCKEYPKGQKGNHYNGVIMATDTLSRENICAGMCCRANLTDLKTAKVLIVPEVANLDDATRQAFVDYAANGGTLYFSGVGDPELLKTLVGATVIGQTADTYTYLAPCGIGESLLDGFTAKYPMPIPAPLPLVEGVPTETVAATITLPYQPEKPGQYTSIHSNPPGCPTEYPGLAVLKYGNGTVIWSAAPIESYATVNYRHALLRFLSDALPESQRILTTTAPKRVELTVTDTPDGTRTHVSAVDLNEEDEAEVQLPFEIQLNTDRPVEKIVLLPEESEIAFTQDEKSVQFTTRALRIFDRYEIRWK